MDQQYQDVADSIQDMLGKKTIADAKSQMSDKLSASALGAVWSGNATEDHIKLAASMLNSKILSDVGVSTLDINHFIRVRSAAGIKPASIPKNTATWSHKSSKVDLHGLTEEQAVKLVEIQSKGVLHIPVEISEVLGKNDPIEDWISDFVSSTDDRFKGKSKEERKKMALGAYYALQKESIDEGLATALHSDSKIPKKTTVHDNLESWQKHAKAAGHEVMQGGSHHVAFNKNNHISGQFLEGSKRGYIDEGETKDLDIELTEEQIAKMKLQFENIDRLNVNKISKIRVMIESLSEASKTKLHFAGIKFVSAMSEGSHDFIQQELASHDINSTVKAHPTDKTKHQLVVDKSSVEKAKSTVKKHGLHNDYDVVGG